MDSQAEYPVCGWEEFPGRPGFRCPQTAAPAPALPPMGWIPTASRSHGPQDRPRRFSFRLPPASPPEKTHPEHIRLYGQFSSAHHNGGLSSALREHSAPQQAYLRHRYVLYGAIRPARQQAAPGHFQNAVHHSSAPVNAPFYFKYASLQFQRSQNLQVVPQNARFSLPDP